MWLSYLKVTISNPLFPNMEKQVGYLRVYSIATGISLCYTIFDTNILF